MLTWRRGLFGDRGCLPALQPALCGVVTGLAPSTCIASMPAGAAAVGSSTTVASVAREAPGEASSAMCSRLRSSATACLSQATFLSYQIKPAGSYVNQN